ncbi:MAG: hypothetical protein IJL06_00805, partial [Kiritimatiellae bacterium]|nr:hypothetical protein [Kiritimatiellia bacterium]
MRTGLSFAFFAFCAACLSAAAQAEGPSSRTPGPADPLPGAEIPSVPAEPDASDCAEAALRDGIPSLAFVEATNALAAAESPGDVRRAFTLAAAALEHAAPPETLLAWLDAFA